MCRFFRTMSTRVRFAPSPTGTLHVGNAMSAIANRSFGDWMLLRIDDTDPARNVPGGLDAIVTDLQWLGVEWQEGPIRASERAERHREAAAGLAQRFEGVMLWRDDGSPTYHLASVVDDVDFGITHVIRGNDHRPNEHLHRRLHDALGTRAPEYIHHGLILGPDGKKLAKRTEGATVASLRDGGIPPEAVRSYLEELDLPRHDVHFDLARIRRLATDVIATLPDDELARRVEAPVELVPALRGSRDLNEAREAAHLILEPETTGPLDEAARPTLERFHELRERANGGLGYEAAKSLVRELKAVGGDLRALRIALTGRDRGPELAGIVAALDRDEALRRIDASLTALGRRRQRRQVGGAQDSAEEHGQAPPAEHPAAKPLGQSGVSPSRSPAPPGGSEGRPGP
jgi:glutamyl-tRNA synthetase